MKLFMKASLPFLVSVFFKIKYYKKVEMCLSLWGQCEKHCSILALSTSHSTFLKFPCCHMFTHEQLE